MKTKTILLILLLLIAVFLLFKRNNKTGNSNSQLPARFRLRLGSQYVSGIDINGIALLSPNANDPITQYDYFQVQSNKLENRKRLKILGSKDYYINIDRLVFVNDDNPYDESKGINVYFERDNTTPPSYYYIKIVNPVDNNYEYYLGSSDDRTKLSATTSINKKLFEVIPLTQEEMIRAY